MKRFLIISNKFRALICSLFFIALMAGTVHIIATHGYHLTYSNSISMPKGFYLIVPATILHRNDVVEFLPPQQAQEYLATKHWAPNNGHLLKHVMGIPGDWVCNSNNAVWINNQKIGPIFQFYAPNKPLPQNHFCGKLKINQYLLLSDKIARSFDGRYFGPITKDQIIGKAIAFQKI